MPPLKAALWAHKAHWGDLALLAALGAVHVLMIRTRYDGVGIIWSVLTAARGGYKMGYDDLPLRHLGCLLLLDSGGETRRLDCRPTQHQLLALL